MNKARQLTAGDLALQNTMHALMFDAFGMEANN